ncbi:MAG: aminotransferase class III-fold pyridoxal phosphate-dependent enzyme [Vicinamibacterales bacterium]
MTPDLQAVAKGLSGGYLPLGAMFVSRRVMRALEAGSGAFAHGHTFQAHPVACAAALEVQRIIDGDGLLANVREMGAYLAERLAVRFADHPHVADIRGRGLFQALEFVADRASLSPFDPARQVAARLKRVALQHGLAVYPGSGTIDGRRGDHVVIAPPHRDPRPDRPDRGASGRLGGRDPGHGLTGRPRAAVATSGACGGGL